MPYKWAVACHYDSWSAIKIRGRQASGASWWTWADLRCCCCCCCPCCISDQSLRIAGEDSPYRASSPQRPVAHYRRSPLRAYPPPASLTPLHPTHSPTTTSPQTGPPYPALSDMPTYKSWHALIRPGSCQTPVVVTFCFVLITLHIWSLSCI